MYVLSEFFSAYFLIFVGHKHAIQSKLNAVVITCL